MTIVDDAATLGADITSSVQANHDDAKTRLDSAVANDAALEHLAALIVAARKTLAVQIAQYSAIVTPPAQ